MNASMELKRCILIYEDSDAAMCTVNRIVSRNGTETIGPGVPMSRIGLNELVRKMAGLTTRRKLLTDRMLYCDGLRMAWWAPECRRPIYFKTRCASFTRAISGTTVVWPALLFIADSGRLAVLALRENSKPVASTPVHTAPFFNLSAGGDMCAGNVRLPSTISGDDIDEWERSFYATEFTHTNTNKLTSHPRGHAGLWAALSRRQLQQFPTRFLLPAKLTVEEAINR
jgi:PRTRC genetic system protein B